MMGTENLMIELFRRYIKLNYNFDFANDTLDTKWPNLKAENQWAESIWCSSCNIVNIQFK